ncbi:MAG TPA: CsbD family protein, partial [Terriglobales bacterium]|nr:CsbD family protein [Terriglobales bacterium]
NWDIIEGRWKQLKGSLKQQWGKLTDSDVEILAGSKDQLVGKIQERYGCSKDEAERQVEEWSRSVNRQSEPARG